MTLACAMPDWPLLDTTVKRFRRGPLYAGWLEQTHHAQGADFRRSRFSLGYNRLARLSPVIYSSSLGASAGFWGCWADDRPKMAHMGA